MTLHPLFSIFHPRSSILMLVFLNTAPAYAQLGASTPPPMLRNVGIEQNLNAQLPLDLIFADEAGQPVALREYFSGKPVVLAFV